MQVPAPFEYERATSVDDALELLERLGPEARVVAGGHSLLPMMKLRLAAPEYLVDINDLERARLHPAVDGDEIRIGALTRHRELLESDAARRATARSSATPSSVIADPVVRNRGTIGGALCQADPSEDLSAVCAALGAQRRHPRRRRRARRRHGRLPPRPVRDRGRRRRDARRGAPRRSATGPAAPTRRSSAAPATGRSPRSAPRLDRRRRDRRRRARPEPRLGATRLRADARGGRAARRSRRPRSCSPRPARIAAEDCSPGLRPARVGGLQAASGRRAHPARAAPRRRARTAQQEV